MFLSEGSVYTFSNFHMSLRRTDWNLTLSGTVFNGYSILATTPKYLGS